MRTCSSCGGTSPDEAKHCMHCGAAYYTLIGVSGRWQVQKLGSDGSFTVLQGGEDVAIAPGEATNVMEVRCFETPDGASTIIQLIVNGEFIGQGVDTSNRIVSGASGVAIAGQPGLVAEFEDIQVSELTVTDDALDTPSG